MNASSKDVRALLCLADNGLFGSERHDKEIRALFERVAEDYGIKVVVTQHDPLPWWDGIEYEYFLSEEEA